MTKKLDVAVQKSKVKPPIARGELIDAMVQLRLKETNQKVEAFCKKKQELFDALENAVVACVRANIATAIIKGCHSNTYSETLSVDIDLKPSWKGFPSAELKAYTEHTKVTPRNLDENECRKSIVNSIRQQRVNLILSDKTIADSLESALLQIGSINA